MARSTASRLAARLIPPAAGALLASLAAGSMGGCLVSFDGYELRDSGGSAGSVTESRSGAGSFASAGRSAGSAGQSALDAGAGGDSATTSGSAGSDSGGSPSDGGTSSDRAGSHSGGVNSAGSSGSAGHPSGGATGTAGTSGAAGHPSGGTSGMGGSGGAVLVCPEKHQRISVQIPLQNGGFYCIDRAEVKNSEYKAFLDEQVGSSGQAAVCAFNTSYEPDTTSSGCNQYDPVGKKNQPIACVDWCDAAAFCKWDGKHLCGNLNGTSNAPASFSDPNQSAWYRACSHAGDFDLPYGNVYDGMKCIGLENTAIHPVAVPYTDCEGGYSGLYDMSGNVAEWEDSCTGSDGANDKCLYRGGSYLDTNRPVAGQPSLLCNSSIHGAPQMATKPRSTRDKEIGFRCCSEPIPAP